MFKPDLLKNKRVLITGGGTGLGKGMAQRFLELGATVYICGRREEVLNTTAAELAPKGPIRALACDVRNLEAVEQMVNFIWSSGPLDILVNNAAGNFIARTEELSPRAFDIRKYQVAFCGARLLQQQRALCALFCLIDTVQLHENQPQYHVSIRNIGVGLQTMSDDALSLRGAPDPGQHQRKAKLGARKVSVAQVNRCLERTHRFLVTTELRFSNTSVVVGLVVVGRRGDCRREML